MLCDLSKRLGASGFQNVGDCHRVITPRFVRLAAFSNVVKASSGATLDSKQLWREFASSATGEWEGITATFSADGQPQQLPERYVPSAFREWQVELYDWQSQCSMLACPDQESLKYRLRKMMPTVGCEADAVAFTEETQTACLPQAESKSEGLQALTIMSDGSYFIGPESLTSDAATAKLEFCIARPNAEPAARVRLVANLAKQSEGWRLQAYEVHMERFDIPYKGGTELLGCGGGQTGLAKSEVTPAHDASSSGWRATSGLRTPAGRNSEEPGTVRQDEGSRFADADALSQITLLPGGLFTRLVQAGPGSTVADLHLHVGWVYQPGSRTVSTVVYRGAGLAAVSMETESQCDGVNQ